MPQDRPVRFSLTSSRALLVLALPLACAVGVEPEPADAGEPGAAGSSGGSLLGTGGSSAGKPSTSPQAGKAGTGSTGGSNSNPFGGTTSTAGKSSGSGGAGGASGGSGGASAGSGSGGAAGSAGSAGSGSGSGCACPKTLTWTDNTVMSWVTGDCVSADGATYLYTGTKPQTYANAQCNPSKQEPWCPDSGNDYKFMACP